MKTEAFNALKAGDKLRLKPDRTFTATIEASQLESAMDLPGWSHCGPEFDRQVFWYPWVAQFRKIYFKAKHRREAAKQCDRCGLLVRDLSEGK